MKDFAQMKVTLTALSDLQTSLLEKKASAEQWFAKYLSEFEEYTKITDKEGSTAYFRKDSNGGEVDCSKWDYKYALERVNQENMNIQAYTDILKYLDSFKF